MTLSVAVGPLISTMLIAYYPVGSTCPPGATVLEEGGYNSGAIFGTGSTTGNISPPPDVLPILLS